jgi:sugar phosphate isomerase/epimerase
MSNNDIELLGLYWTVAGPTDPHGDREWSLFDFADRCEHAARVGMSGTGLWHSDLEHILESRDLKEMKGILEENGLKYLELEFLMNWWLPEGHEERLEHDEIRAMVLEAAGELGAHHVKVGNIFGVPGEIPQVTEAFGRLCEEARERTDATLVYEFMPFDVNVHELDTALEVVTGAAQPNGGLAIDTWHMSKLGIEPDDLRRVPLEYLSWIELSDGQVEDMEDLIEETTRFRALPGEGEFDVKGYVDVAREMGYPGPWGIEVLSDELRSHPIDVIFDRAYASAMSMFD